MIFLAPGTEAAVVQNMARHLAADGVLIAGFQLSVGYLALEEYDRLAEAAGLVLSERYTTWDRAPWTWAGTYAVSVHRRGPRRGAGDRGVSRRRGVRVAAAARVARRACWVGRRRRPRRGLTAAIAPGAGG